MFVITVHDFDNNDEVVATFGPFPCEQDAKIFSKRFMGALRLPFYWNQHQLVQPERARSVDLFIPGLFTNPLETV